MFCEPEAPQPPKLTIKTGRSALARSANRRPRTVRNLAQFLDPTPSISGHSREVDRRSVPETRRRINTALGPRGLRNSLAADVGEGRRFSGRAILADVRYVEANQRRRLQSGRAILRDASSYERPRRRRRDRESASDSVVSLGPSIPEVSRSPYIESNLRDHNDDRTLAFQTTAEIQSSGPEYILTPPHSFAHSLDESTTPYRTTAHVASSSLTSRFAPAHRFDLTEEMLFREFLLRQGFGVAGNVSRDEQSPLQRMEPHDGLEPSRALREVHPDRDDGLGDRRRSLSPEDDFWSTLLATIMPDERLPSAHRSFTSTRGSPYSVSTNSSSSYGVLVPAPLSSNGLDDAYLTICDSSDSERSDTEGQNQNETQGSNTEGYSSQESIGQSHFNTQNSRASLTGEQRARRPRLLVRQEELLQIQHNLERLDREVPR